MNLSISLFCLLAISIWIKTSVSHQFLCLLCSEENLLASIYLDLSYTALLRYFLTVFWRNRYNFSQNSQKLPQQSQIWYLAIKNFGNNHHTSVVGGVNHNWFRAQKCCWSFIVLIWTKYIVAPCSLLNKSLQIKESYYMTTD